MNDLWQWFNDREFDYFEADDRERLEMARLHREAFEFSETDPPAMIQMNRKGRDLAKRLGEPWWTFLYDVWLAIGLEAHVKDLPAALQQCLHCVNEARKPILKEHPWRIAAYNTLLGCYVQIDAVGHEQAIRECLQQLDKEIPPGPSEHRYVMMKHQCDFLMALGELEPAEKLAQHYMALFDQDDEASDWYLLYPVMDMCWIGYHQQDWPKVQAFAEQGEEMARSLENTQLDVVEAQLWQAVVARKKGDEERAKRLFRTAVNRAARLEKKPSREHYDALAYFHESGENLDHALEARDKQLAELAGQGRHGYECEVHLKRCELLARLGRLTQQALQRAQEAMQPLKKPATYLARLKKLESQIRTL